MSELDKILEERGQSYGDFSGIASITQKIKGVLRAHRKWGIPPQETVVWGDHQVFAEASEMIVHKLARATNGDPYNEDTWQDIAGYANLALERARQAHTRGREDEI